MGPSDPRVCATKHPEKPREEFIVGTLPLRAFRSGGRLFSSKPPLGADLFVMILSECVCARACVPVSGVWESLSPLPVLQKGA